jgi:hypothetical protein
MSCCSEVCISFSRLRGKVARSAGWGMPLARHNDIRRPGEGRDPVSLLLNVASECKHMRKVVVR